MHISRLVVSALVLCTVTGPAAVAQHRAAFGITAGSAASRFSGADAEPYTGTLVGIAAGAFLNLELSPYFAIQPEGLFVMKGAKSDVVGQEAKAKISYVEVPLLAKLRLPAKAGTPFSPHLYAGPALAFRVGCSVKSTNGLFSSNCNDADVMTKKTDFSIVAGAGLDIGRATIDVRYDLGLSRLDNSGDNLDAKNRTFYILVGWSFGPPR